MNTLVIVLIAAVLLSCAYVFYGRWLANKWGIDPKAETPAKKFEDGKDYVPTDGWTVFSHQFSSIAGAGPVTGAIQAAVFGWVPVFLWIIVGGIFFGAVTDFGALYASVKNEGKSMGLLIEKYIGKFGRKVFLLFCWLFTLLVIAAFADMVAGTFNAYTEVDGVVKLADAAKTNGAAGTISLLFIVFAMIFGLVQKKFRFHGWKETVVGLVFTVAALGLGMLVPITATKDTWTYITFVYIFFTAVLPMWILKQPRDTMTTYMFIGMIAGAALGLLVAHPTMNLPVFTGFHNDTLGDMFPILFVTVACGAVSGFHSLVSSETSSKLVENEKDMLQVGYGSMLLESLLAILVIVIVGALPNLKASGVLDSTLANMALADTATPFTKFSAGVTGLVAQLGLPQSWGLCIMTMFVSALALTSLDAVARISRMSFQEFFEVEEGQEPSGLVKVLTNKYVSTIISLVCGYLLSLGGYVNIWPLFGSANQLLAAMVLISLAVFLKVTGRKGFMLYIPMVLMFIVTMTALVQAIYGIVMKLFVTGGFVLMVDGLQLVVAILLVALGLMIGFNSGSKLVKEK